MGLITKQRFLTYCYFRLYTERVTEAPIQEPTAGGAGEQCLTAGPGNEARFLPLGGDRGEEFGAALQKLCSSWLRGLTLLAGLSAIRPAQPEPCCSPVYNLPKHYNLTLTL